MAHNTAGLLKCTKLILWLHRRHSRSYQAWDEVVVMRMTLRKTCRSRLTSVEEICFKFDDDAHV